MDSPVSCETQEQFEELQGVLATRRELVHYLCVNHFNSAKASEEDLRKRIQSGIEDAAGFINIIYVYSILDEVGFKYNNPWLSKEEGDEFKAWTHIRHTGAHAPQSRARTFYKEFDEYMTTGYKTNRRLTPSICSWTADSIRVDLTASLNFFYFAQDTVSQAMVRCANAKTNSTSLPELYFPDENANLEALKRNLGQT